MVKFIVYYTILKNLYLSNVGVVTEKLICGLRVSQLIIQCKVSLRNNKAARMKHIPRLVVSGELEITKKFY